MSVLMDAMRCTGCLLSRWWLSSPSVHRILAYSISFTVFVLIDAAFCSLSGGPSGHVIRGAEEGAVPLAGSVMIFPHSRKGGSLTAAGNDLGRRGATAVDISSELFKCSHSLPAFLAICVAFLGRSDLLVKQILAGLSCSHLSTTSRLANDS